MASNAFHNVVAWDKVRAKCRGLPMPTDIPPMLRDFVAAMRALWQEDLQDAERWQRVGRLLPMLLNSAALKESAKSWPAPPSAHPRAQNLLFYEDPDFHFVINGLIKRPGDTTAIHDHAHTWTAYSVLEGEERVVRYRHTGAALEPDGDYHVKPGFIDVVPPRMIHAEFAGPDRTIALIVRSEKVGGFMQGRYDPATGRAGEAPGPEQVPYAL
jgi:predicted metal-dependent enzyme (double-stranded beta helix superfamily)